MLEFLLGNKTIEKILFFLNTYEQGYPKGMAKLFNIPVNGIQQQLRRLEDGGIVVSSLQGKTRLYRFNPRYPFLKEIKTLLQKAMEFFPEKEIEKYYRIRTRPRRKGKPL
ncbi:MAG: winged helix-turn-helix domain-containing protein [Bacteroidota bacterium]